MTLVQLRYLVAIVDAGLNIISAAGRVGATQPGLSQQLKQMEAELGFELFVRRGKSLQRLTEPGAFVVERARIILAETANIRSLAADHRRTALGRLRIATTPLQARFVLPAPLAALRAGFPDLSLSLVETEDAEALDLIGRGAADVAFVSGAERPLASALAIPLYRWNLVAIARKGEPCLVAEMAIGAEDAERLALDGPPVAQITWAVMSRDRLLRGAVQDLVAAMAPHLRREDIRRANDGPGEVNWPVPPRWREIRARGNPPLGWPAPP